MRENRLYGSEGGGTGTTGPSYPYHVSQGLLDPRPTLSRGQAFRGDDKARELIDSLFRGGEELLTRDSDELLTKDASLHFSPGFVARPCRVV